jgi:AbiV family abortive infection protein
LNNDRVAQDESAAQLKGQWRQLTYPQIARGIELCHVNAHRLLRGAAIAFKARNWAGAVFQAILAMEEQGRLLVLYLAYIDGITIDKEWWRVMFGDHRKKLAVLAMGYFIAKGQRKWMRTFRKLGSEYQTLKESAMYVNYQSKSAYWTHPGRINRTKALEVLKSAVEFIKTTEDMMSDEDDGS